MKTLSFHPSTQSYDLSRSSKAFLVLAVITGVVLAAGFLSVPNPAGATEVPFGTKHILNGAFNGVQSAHAADLDKDGDLDILGAAQNSGEVTWWENAAGDGASWITHTLAITFTGASSVHAADLDGDGDLDVLGAAQNADTIVWWENANGDGSAWITATIDVDFGGVSAIFPADMDGDGDLDMLGAALADDEIAWWENASGDGSAWIRYTVVATYTGAASVFAADIDRDGDLDILGSASGNNDVTWWENTAGNGSTWSIHTIDGNFGGASWVYAADVDGDGDLDVLGAANVSQEFAWWENTDGAGSFGPRQTIGTGFAAAESIYADDLDGDGDLDALGAARNGDTVIWWDNLNGDGLTWTEFTIDLAFDGANFVTAADVDGDGDLDVLGTAENANEIAWWENETIHRNALYPTAGAHIVDGNFDDATSVFAGDVDGDGDIDIIGTASNSNQIAWWENLNGDGATWTTHIIDSGFIGARSVHAADVDGDGDLDVLGAATGESMIKWWENLNGDGSSWVGKNIGPGFNAAFWVAAGDMDGDGDTDALGAAFIGNEIAWWENANGNGSTWIQHTVVTTHTGATSVSAADLDGDGDPDILSSAFSIDKVTWWENTAGDGSAWVQHNIDGTFDNPLSTFAADVDGDGDLDVLGAANVSQEFAWWENTDGAGSFGPRQTIGTGFDAAESIYADDLDGDGDLDVLGAALTANTIAWWENANEDGSLWVEHTITNTVLDAISVYTADVDGDGDPDILSAAKTDGEIAWWENQGGQFSFDTIDTAPSALLEGTTDDVLAITASHEGRTGDSSIELLTLKLLFEEGIGDAIGEMELNALVERLHIYLDDGSGVFEIQTDTLVLTLDDLTLNLNQQTVALPGGGPNFLIAPGAPKTYFIVTELTSNAAAQAPNQFLITHLTADPSNQSTAMDTNSDVPLSMAYSPDIPSSIVPAFALAFSFAKIANPEPSSGPSLLAARDLQNLPDPVRPGEVITYSLRLTNTSNVNASAVTITDLMPDEVIISEVKLSGLSMTQTVNGSLYTWGAGSIPADTFGVITITGTIDPNLTSEFIFTNTATLTGTLLTVPLNISSNASFEINISPSVDAGPDQQAALWQIVNVAAAFTDPGLDDTHTATIDWGDGTVESGVVNQLADAVTGSHAYATQGDHTVTITVTDSDGATDTDTLIVSINKYEIYLPITIR